MRLSALLLLAACSPGGPWLSSPRVLVEGVGVAQHDCRGGICQHNENTDLVRFQGDLFLVHRTAESQILGPNSSLRVSRSRDEGASVRAPQT